MAKTSTSNQALLSGNEALAYGAYEAGLSVACAYPGTPSTEVLETLAQFPDVDAQWSVNEKVAFEVALGAAIAGARSLFACKHVGLNVAMDPLMTASYTGILAGSSMGSFEYKATQRVSCSFCEECIPGSSATTTTKPARMPV